MSETNGKRFIDKLVAASPTERRKVSILGQDIYFTPLTRKQLAEAMPNDKMDRAPDYAGLFLLVQTAEDEAGNKLFKKTDIEALRTKVSLALLQQIESAMLGVQAPSMDTIAEEAAQDPPSAPV